MLIAFHKPYGVLSQFTPDGSPNRPLAEFNFPKGVYPIGRLDADSEGLLLLSDEAELNERLLHPKNAHRRTYWAQLERSHRGSGVRRVHFSPKLRTVEPQAMPASGLCSTSSRSSARLRLCLYSMTSTRSTPIQTCSPLSNS